MIRYLQITRTGARHRALAAVTAVCEVQELAKVRQVQGQLVLPLIVAQRGEAAIEAPRRGEAKAHREGSGGSPPEVPLGLIREVLALAP